MGTSRLSRFARAALAAMLVLGGVVLFAAPAVAVPPVITAPNAVFGLVNAPLVFNGPDPYSGDERLITTNAQSANAQCTGFGTGSQNLAGCVVVYLSLGNAGSGTLTMSTAGVLVTAGTVGSPAFQFNATAAAAATALATLTYVPESGYSNVPSSPATLKIDVRDGVTQDYSGTPLDSNDEPTTRYVAIRTANLNSPPVNTVPGGATVAASSSTAYPAGEFTVADSDVSQEANDGMLLVMWADCGQVSISGGALTIANDISNLADFLVSEGLPEPVADAVIAALPSEVTSLVLSSDYTEVAAVAGYGSLSEVQNALSTVTFHAPATAGSCTLNQFVTDLGNNGLPVLAGYVNLTDADNEIPTGIEIPDPLNLLDWDTVVFTVTDSDAITVTVNQGATQADPVYEVSGVSPVVFDVVFSEPVENFTTGDIVVSGTAGPGSYSVEDDGDGNAATYRVHVAQAADFGTIIVTLAAGAATAGTNPVRQSAASTSTDNQVLYLDDNPPAGTQPTVLVSPATGQGDPTAASPIVFDVVFSTPVVGFEVGDLSGAGTTAGGVLTYALTGSGAAYSVSVTGMTTDGEVALSVPGNRVGSDPGGAGNTASNTESITWDDDAAVPPAPDVTVIQGATQPDPTSTSPIVFDVTFTQPVTGLTTADFTQTGTAGGLLSITLTGAGAAYTATVTGMTTAGTVILALPAGAAQNAELTNSTASTGDNSVTWIVTEPTAPTVTINQAAGQADPASTSPIVFDVVFSEPVVGLTGGDIDLSGTAGATSVTVIGSGATYTASVSGMTGPGTVSAVIAAGAVIAVDDGAASASSTSTDNTVLYAVPPTVTIDQPPSQIDPASTSPIYFVAQFSQMVEGFTAAEVLLSGSAGATTAVFAGGDPTSYLIAVSGMTAAGTVIVTIPAGVATTLAAPFLPNLASTSTDNVVTWTTATDQPTTSGPTTGAPSTEPPATGVPSTPTGPSASDPSAMAPPASPLPPAADGRSLAATGAPAASLLPIALLLAAGGVLLLSAGRTQRRH